MSPDQSVDVENVQTPIHDVATTGSRSTVLNALTTAWLVVVTVWTAWLVYQLVDTRALFTAIEQDIGRMPTTADDVLTDAVSEGGRYGGEHYNLAPSRLSLSIGAFFFYPAGFVLAARIVFKESTIQLRTVLAMAALVVVHVALSVFFSSELDATTFFTDT